jgi:hypothetical protein
LTGLANSYGKPVGRCAEMLRKIPIIHLHGDLGGLPYYDNELARDYKPSIDTESLSKASQRIKIIYEGIEKEPQFTLAKELLSKSESICFLGFGYHYLNMERLGFNAIPVQLFAYGGKRIRGTSYGLKDAECVQLNNRFGLGLRNPSGFGYPVLDVLNFLREFGVLHSD